jgi:glucan phosphoethanolaminetransferase (alkaline phosphatase superfamily)
MKDLKKQMRISERSFYATLACFLTCFINLFYYLYYKTNPLTLVAVFPLIFWIAYDGNEEGKITKLGFWYWVSLLLTTSILTLIYPLF